MRDGQEHKIMAEELVPGDVILLSEAITSAPTRG